LAAKVVIRPPVQLQQAIELSSSIVAALRPNRIGSKYPELLTGVSTDSIHAAVLSYLVLVGDALGYRAYVDAPHFDGGDARLLGVGHKRPDSLWFEKGSEQTVLVAEFEQYRTASLLADKARNLVLMDAARRTPPRLLVLVSWASGQVDWAQVREVLTRGMQIGPATQDRLVPRAACLLAELKVVRGTNVQARALVPIGLVYGGVDYAGELQP
jgi:hypothetical protein